MKYYSQVDIPEDLFSNTRKAPSHKYADQAGTLREAHKALRLSVDEGERI